MIKNKKIFIVAEAGNNHEGRFAVAKKLVDAAHKSGADAIKFQTYNVDKFILAKNKKTYQKFKKYSLTLKQFQELSSYCKHKGIIFFSTPFDLKSATFLNNVQNIFKISSGDNNFYDLIKKVSKFDKELIISTGASEINEIKDIYKIVKRIRGKNNLKLSFLHCVSSYPAILNEINLLSLMALKKAFPKVRIGFSDHTIGIKAPLYAALMGAKIIEKHFTLDNKFSNFRDHKISLNPSNFKKMVILIREAEKIMGEEKKIIQKSEKNNLVQMRRAAYAKYDLSAGNKLKKSDIIFLRPGNGIANGDILKFYGKKIKKKIFQNQKLNKKYFS